jgi:hypothetical protein
MALVECVLEQSGETKRVPENIYPARNTAWWEITVPSRTKYLLIMDPVAVVIGHRRYFVQGGGAHRYWEPFMKSCRHNKITM